MNLVARNNRALYYGLTLAEAPPDEDPWRIHPGPVYQLKKPSHLEKETTVRVIFTHVFRKRYGEKLMQELKQYDVLNRTYYAVYCACTTQKLFWGENMVASMSEWFSLIKCVEDSLWKEMTGS